MKILQVLIVFAVVAFVSTSCEKCYNCIATDGSESEAHICSTPTAVKAIKAEYEADGYICNSAN